MTCSAAIGHYVSGAKPWRISLKGELQRRETEKANAFFTGRAGKYLKVAISVCYLSNDYY